MKIRFLSYNLLLVLVLYSGLIGYTIPKDYAHIECPITPMIRQSKNLSHPHIPGPVTKKPKNNQVTSTNWCGYAAATNMSNPIHNTVSAVYGSWIVPSITPANDNTYSAIWIGIDGYSSPSVEQIGTGHDYVNGVAQHYAWFEMYPGGSYSINGFPVNPGDVISAAVLYAGNNIFTLILTNDTKKVAVTIPTNYTTLAGAQRSSAEWIVEAPYSNGILPLTDFGTTYLWGCIATINGVTNPINNNSWRNVSLEMVTSGSLPKATPSALLQDNGSFFATWAHQ